MKNFFINKCISSIRNYYSYDETKIREIKYGLETLYVTITKTVVIFLIAYCLNIFKELLLLMTFYGLLRCISHGLHAKKSWQCWISSLITFLLIPYLIKIMTFTLLEKIVICICTLFLLILYSPADTEKKPIINRKKRIILKTITAIISITYILILFSIKNNTIINSLIFALIIQATLVTPISYKIFDLKYQNYKFYSEKLKSNI